MEALQAELNETVERINSKYGSDKHTPLVWLDRAVPHYERIALYSIADCTIVTATRDGMNMMEEETQPTTIIIIFVKSKKTTAKEGRERKPS